MTSSSAYSISVIIPCHNHGRYLAEALQSALSQSCRADEIIVVDDGSSDETPDVARRFADRVRYVAQSHQGIGSARNTGVKQAWGAFVAFLDADDLWPSGSLDFRIKQFENNPAVDAAMGMTEEFISPDFQTPLLAARAAQGPVTARLAGAMLMRRRAFEQVGGFDQALGVGEWIEWMDRFSHAGLRLATLPELVLRRRIHAVNASRPMQASSGDYLTVLRASLRRKAAASDPQR